MPIFTEGQDPLDEPPREPTKHEMYVQWLRDRLAETTLKLDGDPDGVAARHMVLLLQDLAAATGTGGLY